MPRIVGWFLRLAFGLIVFYVVLRGGQEVGANSDLTLVVAAAAAFGSIALTVKIGH